MVWLFLPEKVTIIHYPLKDSKYFLKCNPEHMSLFKSSSGKISFMETPQSPFDDKSTLIQVMS